LVSGEVPVDGVSEALAVLERFVEEASRPCLLGLPGKKVEMRVGKDLSAYFMRLKGKLNVQRLAKLAETASTPASGRFAAEHLAKIATRRMQPQLMAALKAGILEAAHVAKRHKDMRESAEDEPRDDHGRCTSGSGSGMKKDSIPMSSGKERTEAQKAADQRKTNSRLKRDYHRQWVKSGKKGSFEDYVKKVDVTKAKDILASEADSQPYDRSSSTILDDAVEWAERQAADLVAGIDQTTVDSIADAVANGIESQLGVPGTAKEIHDLLDGWSSSRAFTIATTEINRAMSAATFEGLGGGYKQWILAPEACPICEDNEAQGAIPWDDEFDSGDMYPPAHPNCRCAVASADPPDDGGE
jgi:hypothetical protein